MIRLIFWLFTIVLGCVAALSGCAELAYYQQAAAGQWQLLQTRQPVTNVLDDPATSATLRQKLETTQALRTFASTELALPDNGSYRNYADLQRPWAVKNVFAAPELALEPRHWCFPMVGCLSYRGYFDAEAAQHLAEELRAAGDDVYVADISAYSTLGWFDDPLLNTFIGGSTGQLAELMFHELAHQKLYITDETAFNEAFATAVGRLGAERWLKQHGTPSERQEYQASYQRQRQFLQLVAVAREQLLAIYSSSRSDADKRTEKQRILTELRSHYQQLKQDWNGYSGYDRWFDQDLNNAKLAGVSTYHRWVPAFLALYQQQGQNFMAFYGAVETLGQLPHAEREAQMQALLIRYADKQALSE